MPIVPPIKNITVIPKDKHGLPVLADPATFDRIFPGGLSRSRVNTAQSGVVQMKVLINRICPFRKSPKVENVLTFNNFTAELFDQYVKDSIELVGVADGVTLNRRYVYRHNFLINRFNVAVGSDSQLVTKVPIYKPHLTWREMASVFVGGIDDAKCSTLPFFRYSAEHVQSAYEGPDLVNDGIKPPSKESRIVTGFQPPSVVQAVYQENTQTCSRKGIHWKLIKTTHQFMGEDFFIHFFRKTEQGARNTGVNNTLQAFPFGNIYKYLDATLEKFKDFLPLNVDPKEKNKIQLPVNFGVATWKWDDDEDRDVNQLIREKSDTSYVLSDQPYIIIEMDGRTLPGLHANRFSHHYFLLITDRGFPRLIVEMDGISFALDTYQEIIGKQLFDAKDFRVTVQNHLGKLIIRFDINGEPAPPWFIERRDWTIDQGSPDSRVVLAVVPEGPISVWGGHLKTSFIYGPLQYVKNAKIPLPPRAPVQRKIFKVAGLTAKVATSPGSDFRFALPKGGTHRFTFSTSDEEVKDILGFGFLSLYTCDAQLFKEIDEEKKSLDGLIRNKGEVSIKGRFYRGSHYKALSSQHRPLTLDIDGKTATFGKFIRGGPQDADRSILAVRRSIVGTDQSRRLTKFNLMLDMTAGNHVFSRFANKPASPGGSSLFEDKWVVAACKTPIMTLLRMIADDPEEKRRWEPQCVDVSEHVMQYSDSWTAQDFNRIEHTGQISFLLNRGSPASLNRFDQLRDFSRDQIQFLESLTNKNFYIEVWAGYRGCNYSQLNGFFKLFTGICDGGSIEYSAGRRVMACQIKDYTSVLEGQRLFNSPYYDGVIDIFAIKELLTMAGFRSVGPGDYEEKPAGVIEKARAFTEATGNEARWKSPDGRESHMWPYALPSGYARLQEPKFKFTDSTTFMEAIDQITRRAAKLFYFDQFGVAHYENYLDSVISNLRPPSFSQPTNNTDILNELALRQLQTFPLFWFTSNATKYVGQLVFNQYSVQMSVADVHNHIKLLSNTPDFTPMFFDDLEWPSIEDPTSEGFLGYLKTFYQEEGVFGDKETAGNTMALYRSFFKPPVLSKFETYGQPVRALDLIALDNRPYRVMRVNSTIEPEKNLWWQQFEGEWLQPSGTQTAQTS